MDVRSILTMLVWLAVLGAIVYYGTRVAGRAAAKV